MNSSNPFQIPSCLQVAVIRQRRREHFRRGVAVVVAAVVVLLVALLIEGCRSEHAVTASSTTAEIAGLPAAPPVPVPAPPSKQVFTPLAPPVTPSAIEPSLSLKAGLLASSRPALVYVVRSGDTLVRIARLHQTTARVLKAINSLGSDKVAVGAKLKLPSA
jgi:LysM repeat protein